MDDGYRNPDNLIRSAGHRMTSTSKYILRSFLLVCLLLAGCIKEGLDDCPEEGYRLFFYYPGNGTTDVFPAEIDHVGLLFYDSGGRLVLSRDYSRSELQRYQGAEPDLAEGNYTVVAWGNIAGYTVLSGEDNIDSGRAYQSQYAAGTEISNFDSLYFGRRQIYIEPASSRTDTLEFRSAHIKMEMHIAGYGDIDGTRASGQGLIELLNVPVGYDFSMTLTSDRSPMYPVWNNDASPEIIDARFNLLRFEDDTDMVINILAPDGTVKGNVVLSEFLAENNITVEGINEITVPIYILFEGPEFYVTVDGWKTTPVDPIPKN